MQVEKCSMHWEAQAKFLTRTVYNGAPVIGVTEGDARSLDSSSYSPCVLEIPARYLGKGLTVYTLSCYYTYGWLGSSP